MKKKCCFFSCFRAVVAVLLAIVFFISGCSCGPNENAEPEATSDVQTTFVPMQNDAENSELSILDGSCVTERITDSASALRALEGIAEYIGISDVAACYKSCSEQQLLNDMFYSCQQEYNGVPVYGSSIDFIVDKEGKCLNVIGNHAKISSMNTSPKLTEEEAVQTALYNRATDVTSNGLCIYSCFDTTPCLAYDFYGNENGIPMQFFVSAETGEALAAFPCGYTDETVEGSGFDRPRGGIERRLNLHRIYEELYLHDRNRNIAIFNAEGKAVLVETGGAIDTSLHTYRRKNAIERVMLDENDNEYMLSYDASDKNYYLTPINDTTDQQILIELVPSIQYTTENNAKARFQVMSSSTTYVENSRAVAAMSYAAYSYDFFADILCRNGFDNNDGFTGVIFDSNFYDNACSMNHTFRNAENEPYIHLTCIEIGKGEEITYDLIGHEYTHSVENTISKMLYQGETGAIKEGYSDIFGELIEDYANNATAGNPTLSGSCDWIHGRRNISNPEKSKLPAVYKGKYWKNANVEPTEGNDYGHVHDNSTVISHIAYLLSTGMDGTSYCEALDNRQITELFYRALFMLPIDCSFNQFSRMLLRSAELMYEREMLNSKQFTCIMAVLDNAGIEAQNSEITGMAYTVKPGCLLDVRGLDLLNCECAVKMSKVVIRDSGIGADSSHPEIDLVTVMEETINKPTKLELSGGKYFVLEIRNAEQNASDSEVYKVILKVDSQDGKTQLVFYTKFGIVNQNVNIDMNVQVAAGNSISYAITEDGSLWEWGVKCGTRLVGSTTPVMLLKNVASVSTSGFGSFDESTPEVWSHTLAVTKDGSLYGWGFNGFGQATGIEPADIYEGEDRYIDKPTFIMDGIRQASAGIGLSAAVRTNGDLLVWGTSQREYDANHSVKVVRQNVASVEIGSAYSGTLFVLKRDGTVEVGMLQNNKLETKKVMEGVAKISGIEGYEARCFAIKNDGTLWLIEAGSNLADIKTVSVMQDVISASAYCWDLTEGKVQVYVVTKEGKLLQAEDCNMRNFSVVREGILSVSAGDKHTLAVTEHGEVMSWGSNEYGQLGIEKNVSETSEPVLINEMSNVRSAAIGEDSKFALVVKNDDSLWACGMNDRGQLGTGTTENSDKYIKIMSNVSKVAAGEDFAFAVKQDGTLWAWGANNEGQLGDGKTVDRLSPVKIADGIVDVNTRFALTDDGRMLEISLGFAEAANGVSEILADNLAIMHDGTLWLCYSEGDDNLYVTDNVKSAYIEEATCYVIKSDNSLWVIELFSEDPSSDVEIGEGYQQIVGYSVKEDSWSTVLLLLGTNNRLYEIEYFGDDGLYLKIISYNIKAMAVSSADKPDAAKLCIDNTGLLYAWGTNDFGVFGKGWTAGDANTPCIVVFTGT